MLLSGNIVTQRGNAVQFVYEGFTHAGQVRSFNFQGIDPAKSSTVFSIEVDLPLLARHRVNMQDGPGFCLQMLTVALAAGPDSLQKLQHYRIVEEDLRPILVDRANRAALKALKTPPRRFVRKPPVTSQLRGLGAPEPR